MAKEDNVYEAETYLCSTWPTQRQMSQRRTGPSLDTRTQVRGEERVVLRERIGGGRERPWTRQSLLVRPGYWVPTPFRQFYTLLGIRTGSMYLWYIGTAIILVKNQRKMDFIIFFLFIQLFSKKKYNLVDDLKFIPLQIKTRYFRNLLLDFHVKWLGKKFQIFFILSLHILARLFVGHSDDIMCTALKPTTWHLRIFWAWQDNVGESVRVSE